MIDIQVFQDVGPIVNGRGTPIEVTTFNMKASADYTAAYYPTEETAAAPLIRPLIPGTQTLSYKVYTFFKLNGSYNQIKNLRFKVAIITPPEATNSQLFYKNTNIYEQPTNNFDGDMMLLTNSTGLIYPGNVADDNGLVNSLPIYPMISTVGPNQATTRQTVYTGTSPLYTNYFVTQIRVNAGALVGNTPELRLKFEAYEFEG